jgi:hypothetical protein
MTQNGNIEKGICLTMEMMYGFLHPVYDTLMPHLIAHDKGKSGEPNLVNLSNTKETLHNGITKDIPGIISTISYRGDVEVPHLTIELHKNSVPSRRIYSYLHPVRHHAHQSISRNPHPNLLHSKQNQDPSRPSQLMNE